VALGREALELARPDLAQALDRLATEQRRVALVDRLDVERRLAPREVQDVLLLEGPEELLDLRAIGVDVHGLPA
jgi:hypothetical protein